MYTHGEDKQLAILVTFVHPGLSSESSLRPDEVLQHEDLRTWLGSVWVNHSTCRKMHTIIIILPGRYTILYTPRTKIVGGDAACSPVGETHSYKTYLCVALSSTCSYFKDFDLICDMLSACSSTRCFSDLRISLHATSDLHPICRRRRLFHLQIRWGPVHIIMAPTTSYHLEWKKSTKSRHTAIVRLQATFQFPFALSIPIRSLHQDRVQAVLPVFFLGSPAQPVQYERSSAQICAL